MSGRPGRERWRGGAGDERAAAFGAGAEPTRREEENERAAPDRREVLARARQVHDMSTSGACVVRLI